MKVPERLRIIFLTLFMCLFVISCGNQDESSALKSQPSCKRTADMPEKYRLDNYRAPTPDCVPNAITINTAELQDLNKKSPLPILIDVLSVITRPNVEFGESKWLPNKERLSLPDSVWLPNIGYGYLDEQMQHYFKTQLLALTKGNKSRPLVFFCIADCWMSWNSVQRARDYGYDNVYWYKNGTDGWTESGLAVVKIDPIPLSNNQE